MRHLSWLYSTKFEDLIIPGVEGCAKIVRTIIRCVFSILTNLYDRVCCEKDLTAKIY